MLISTLKHDDVGALPGRVEVSMEAVVGGGNATGWIVGLWDTEAT